MEEIEEFIKKIKGNGIIRKLDELGRIVIPMEYRMNKIVDGETKVRIYSINNYVIVEILKSELKENIKKFNNLGRIVIQKEIRKNLGWIEDDEIIVWDCENVFILQKLRKECVFCKKNNNLMEFKRELICEECKNELKEI